MAHRYVVLQWLVLNNLVGILDRVRGPSGTFDPVVLDGLLYQCVGALRELAAFHPECLGLSLEDLTSGELHTAGLEESGDDRVVGGG